MSFKDVTSSYYLTYKYSSYHKFVTITFYRPYTFSKSTSGEQGMPTYREKQFWCGLCWKIWQKYLQLPAENKAYGTMFSAPHLPQVLPIVQEIKIVGKIDTVVNCIGLCKKMSSDWTRHKTKVPDRPSIYTLEMQIHYFSKTLRGLGKY